MQLVIVAGILLSAPIVVAIHVSGCAHKHHIVAEGLSSWEVAYVRAIPKPEAMLPTPEPTPAIEKHTHGPVEPHSPDVSREAAEMISVPFRIVAWILRTIF